MGRERQLFLPGFENLEEISVPRKTRFPQGERFGASLDLPTIEKIRKRIEEVQRDAGFSLSEIFPTKEEIPKDWFERDEVHYYLPLIRLYLYEYSPQEEVAAQLGLRPESASFVPWLLFRACQRIVGRARFGKDAIETLKPTKFLYERLKEAGLNTTQDVLTLADAVPKDESEKEYPHLARLVTSRRLFNELMVIVRKRGGQPEWDPKVTFVDELPPEKASKY
ncbi:hypothetical protein HY503_01600 [Candidatus Woesebacteria bacterium]|nr:hypothetical protein [Candidatus Woesebacteria bacterium]